MYVRLNILGEMGPSLGLSSPRKPESLEWQRDQHSCHSNGPRNTQWTKSPCLV